MADEFIKEKLDMIEECIEYMERVIAKIDTVCPNIRKKEGIEVIAQISDGFSAVLQIVKHTSSVTGIEIDDSVVSEFVSDMVDGMENGDFNLVADIIEYEIAPLYEEWSGVFDRVLSENV